MVVLHRFYCIIKAMKVREHMHNLLLNLFKLPLMEAVSLQALLLREPTYSVVYPLGQSAQ